METKKSLIDYSILEKVIIDIENVFKDHNCDMEGKQLVMKQLNQRLMKNVQQQRTSDLVSGFGGGMIGKLMNRHKDDEEN